MTASRLLPRLRLAVGQRRGFSASARRLENYGFIGLGQMGFPMAKNLQAKLAPGDKVFVHDANEAAAEAFVREIQDQPSGGATVELAKNPLEASRDSDVVMTVLPQPSHVQSVFSQILTPDLKPRSAGPRLFVDCSTIDPLTSRQVGDSVRGAGHYFADAPMSGGVVGALAGTLTFMLGVDSSLLERTEPLLLRMGKRVLHCGAQGAGLSAKLANNYLLAINNIATAEAMNLGARWGLDPAVLAGVINSSTGRCWPSEVNNPVPGVVDAAPASRDYSGGFGIALMRKDLKLAMAAAHEAGAHLGLADAARAMYEEAENRDDCKGRDFSVVYRHIQAVKN